MNRFIAKIIILAAVFAAGAYTQYQYGVFGTVQERSTQEKTAASGEQSAKDIRLMIDFGDGTIETFNDIAWYEGETVFDALLAASEKNDLKLKYKDYGGDLGIFLEAISDKPETGNTEKWWQYWINNDYGTIGASNNILSAGDIIEWKLTKGQQ